MGWKLFSCTFSSSLFTLGVHSHCWTIQCNSVHAYNSRTLWLRLFGGQSSHLWHLQDQFGHCQVGHSTHTWTEENTYLISALDFCNSPVWNFQFNGLDYYVVYFKLEFYSLQAGWKIQFIKLDTYFEQENFKNQVQIDGESVHVSIEFFLCLLVLHIPTWIGS